MSGNREYEKTAGPVMRMMGPGIVGPGLGSNPLDFLQKMMMARMDPSRAFLDLLMEQCKTFDGLASALVEKEPKEVVKEGSTVDELVLHLKLNTKNKRIGELSALVAEVQDDLIKVLGVRAKKTRITAAKKLGKKLNDGLKEFTEVLKKDKEEHNKTCPDCKGHD